MQGVRDEWLAGVRLLRQREMQAAAAGGADAGEARHGGIHGYGGWRVDQQGEIQMRQGFGWASWLRSAFFLAVAVSYFFRDSSSGL